jgi:hypothetical protein
MAEAKRKYHWLGKSTADFNRLTFLAKNFVGGVRGTRVLPTVDKKRRECYPSLNFRQVP